MSKNKKIKIKRALLSVSDKTGLVEFAKELKKLNIEIISTGGTEKLLRKNKIPVIPAEEFTGSPEMMNGRVKTLVPKIHGAILSRRNQDKEEIKKHGIQEIDLVVVNLYPFEETIKKKNISIEEAIENIDIGGPTMLRSAAKNFFHVAVISSSSLYKNFISDLKSDSGKCSYEVRRKLSLKAFEHVANYDIAIANFLSSFDDQIPEKFFTSHKLKQELRYGENPHQSANFYINSGSDGAGITSAKQIQGKELSYNNIADTDAAIECVSNFEKPSCVIVKHANPCGVASGKTLLEAYENAFSCDETSAFGGIIALNKPLDKITAKKIIENQFVEVIAAPAINPAAKKVISTKKNVRLLLIKDLFCKPTGFKTLTMNQGILVQNVDDGVVTKKDLKVVTKKKPTSKQVNDALFAWRVGKYVKSNAIVYAKNNMTLGIGAGQMSRIDSAQIAVNKAKKAGFNLKGATMASDAFFPFRDSIDEAAKNGIQCVIQPGGSIRDKEVIAAANEANMIMFFTNMRHFRH